MKRSDSTILLILPLVALVAAFWLLVLGPKRQEASKLGDEVAKLRSEVDDQTQLAAQAVEAKKSFPGNYRKVVELGRAVPQDDDTASLFAELTALSRRAGVDFRAIELDAAGGGTPAPTTPAPTTPAPTGDSADSGKAPAPDGSSSPDSGASGGATPASTAPTGAATEAGAANLPIGATVGPAGFPVMPYKLSFRGDFFRVADFIHQLDRMVTARNGLVSVRGRLLTIDGFALNEDTKAGFPALTAQFSVTTYLTPSGEGVTGGATPQAPTAAVPAQPTSAPAPAAPALPTAAPGG